MYKTLKQYVSKAGCASIFR